MEPKKRIEVKIKSYDLPPDVVSEPAKTNAKTAAKAVVVPQSGNAQPLQTTKPKKKFVVTIKEDDEISDILEKTESIFGEKAAKPAAVKHERKPYELDDTVTRIIKEADAIKKDKEASEAGSECTEEAPKNIDACEFAAAAKTEQAIFDKAEDDAKMQHKTSIRADDKKKSTNNKKTKKKKTKKKKYVPKNPVARFLKKFVPWAGDTAGEAIRKTVVITALIVAGGCVYTLVEYFESEKESVEKIEDLAQMRDQYLEDEGKSEISVVDPSLSVDDEEFIPPMLGSQQIFYDKNNDVIGWIEIENTRVYLPILQADDNDYYLERDIYGEHDEYGSIYADYRCVLTHNQQSDNLVIYGHDTRTGSMFGDLDQYKKDFGTIKFLREHPVIKLDSNYYRSEYVIFAVIVTNTKEEDGEVWGYQNEIEFTDELDFMTFVSNCKKRSMYDTYIDVEYGEKMVTLSTCATDFDEARLVIVARELREGETGYEYVDNYEYNDNTLYPDVWYRYRGGKYDDTDTRYDIETLYPDSVQ